MRRDSSLFKGKEVVKFEISKDRYQLLLHFSNNESLVLETYADCCSDTWIESLDLPDNLLGKIIRIDDIRMRNLGDIPTPYKEEVDHVKYYGLKITTDKGSCVIDYRNDSNGYYGGDITISLRKKGE